MPSKAINHGILTRQWSSGVRAGGRANRSGGRGVRAGLCLALEVDMCSNDPVRWSGQQLAAVDVAAPPLLPGLAAMPGLVRSVTTPEFAGVTFHEVLARSALNKVPAASGVPFDWTVNPYRGCTHACVYCFARSTHRYLDLDTGADFDSQVVVKVNVAEVLERELARRSWARAHVALGTNTDPYQRAEGRYRLMPGVISALADSGTPFSILTKGTLLRRDLPLLVEAAQRVPVDLAISCAVHDEALHGSLEPGTPSPAARLATVRAATDLGFDVGVYLMPVLPHLTDSDGHLDAALEAIAASGAAFVGHTPLHLRPGAREWFLGWLAREQPHLVAPYRELYAGGSYVARPYREWLATRFAAAVHRHVLDRPRPPRSDRFRTSGTWGAAAWRDGALPGAVAAADPPATLF